MLGHQRWWTSIWSAQPWCIKQDPSLFGVETFETWRRWSFFYRNLPNFSGNVQWNWGTCRSLHAVEKRHPFQDFDDSTLCWSLKEINEIHPANRGFQFPRRWTFGWLDAFCTPWCFIGLVGTLTVQLGVTAYIFPCWMEVAAWSVTQKARSMLENSHIG